MLKGKHGESPEVSQSRGGSNGGKNIHKITRPLGTRVRTKNAHKTRLKNSTRIVERSEGETKFIVKKM
jgi:hypothetical protein